jgi:Mn2+/Fe2+ NRAMP family transporter
MLVAVQEMCARIGLVTKQGLTGTIKKYYPKYILYLILLLSFPSITLNIGADIAGMGAVANLLVPQIPSFIFSIVFTGILMYSIVFWNYRKISNVLKWLCLTLFSYILIPFIAHTDWLDVLKNTLIPSFENSKVFYLTLVGILGTTISPYLFFWQASMEVEESNQRHIVVDKRIISEMKTDVRGGLVLTNVVFFFIILSTGTVLYNAGAHQISSVEDAARALKPLAGDFAYFLFALGVLGTGFIAIPVLAGSLSYMLAETFNWQEGLDKKFQEAKGFYITILISLFIGLMINAFGWNPIIALIYAAVLYGITAPVLILLILHICNNKLIMGKYVNGFWINFFGISTFLVMSFASFMLIYLYLV